MQITHSVEVRTDVTHEHMLASLAEEAKKLLKKDSMVFMPILSKWHQQAAAVSASLLHKLYGQKLVSSCCSKKSPSTNIFYCLHIEYGTFQLFAAYSNVVWQKPFLDHVEHLTEDAVSVFPAAESLEQYVMMVIASVCGDDGVDAYCKQKLTLYQVWKLLKNILFLYSHRNLFLEAFLFIDAL